MEPVAYPYMAPGRTFLFVSSTHPLMAEAVNTRGTHAGDPLFPVGAILVRDDRVIARAGNGFNRGSGESHLCPRILQGCKSGEGYDLCHLHDTDGHAEPMAVAMAKQAGENTVGADCYLYGHWWCCEPCWKALIDAGIRNVYLPEDAHLLFSKEAVYSQTLKGYPEEIRKKYGIV